MCDIIIVKNESYEEGNRMSLYQRMYDVFHPVNTEGGIALIAIILWLILSFVCRKEFGGFFSALKSLGITVLIIAIMWWIHPAFAVFPDCLGNDCRWHLEIYTINRGLEALCFFYSNILSIAFE